METCQLKVLEAMVSLLVGRRNHENWRSHPQTRKQQLETQEDTWTSSVFVLGTDWLTEVVSLY